MGFSRFQLMFNYIAIRQKLDKATTSKIIRAAKPMKVADSAKKTARTDLLKFSL